MTAKSATLRLVPETYSYAFPAHKLVEVHKAQSLKAKLSINYENFFMVAVFYKRLAEKT